MSHRLEHGMRAEHRDALIPDQVADAQDPHKVDRRLLQRHGKAHGPVIECLRAAWEQADRDVEALLGLRRVVQLA